jgi:outer membrane protein OmpA-like peptidoglycan-associated protein
MSSIRTRVAALVAAAGCVMATWGVSSAEVGGFHVNLTPYAGFGTWGPGVNMQDKLMYGGRLGLGFGRTFGIEGTYGISSTETQRGQWIEPYAVNVGLPADPLDADWTHLGIDALWHLSPESPVVPYLLVGYASQNIEVDGGGEADYSGVEFGAGFKLQFSPRVALRLEARDAMMSFEDDEVAAGADDEGQHNLLYSGGLMFAIGGDADLPDADADGVPDKKDECPDTPAGCVVDAKGCPVDSDGDGVCDGIDQCANTPSGVTVDARGCPVDSDADTVPDGIDTCPNTPAGCTVDAQGCPVDSDRDGVCDGLDQCANTPTGARVDEKGCPMDSDGDGVPDGIDVCPNTPAGARVDKDGCPIEITQREMEMLEKGAITARDIYFDTGKATLKPESENTLRELCTIFQQWPTLQIEIGGHTDSQGSNAFNQTLSEQRAQAVVDWARTNCPNLNSANFSSKGYGETQPVAKNSTAAGRAQNRRVEFKVLNPEELRRLKERRETLMRESGGTN